MPILSHLHQLFDVQTCYAYIGVSKNALQRAFFVTGIWAS
jgi:hypothetical protein